MNGTQTGKRKLPRKNESALGEKQAKQGMYAAPLRQPNYQNCFITNGQMLSKPLPMKRGVKNEKKS